MRSPASAATFIELTSQPGDYIGAGQSFVLSESEGITATRDSGNRLSDHVEIRVGDGTWYLEFAAPFGQLFSPGTYTDAMIYPFGSPTAPGLSVSGDGRGCDRVTGTFSVLEAQFTSGVVQRFALDFEQHCDGGPALYGVVRINSDVGDSVPTPTPRSPTPTPTQYVSYIALNTEPGDTMWGGISTVLDPSQGILTATHSHGYLTINFLGGADNSWTLEFAAPQGDELLPGTYGGAREIPFELPSQPGLSVGRGCQNALGTFVIFAVEYGPGGSLVKTFAADFELHCDGATAGLVGVVRYNSTLPLDLPTPIPPSPTPTPTAYYTFVDLDSQSGDYVGSGMQRRLTTADGTFTTSHEPGHVYVQFDGFTGDEMWEFDFSAPAGMDLVPGAYQNAQRYPFQSPIDPGLDVGGDGRGCDTITGQFAILDAEYAADGSVQSLAVDFEQHCGAEEAALIGRLRINSDVPADAPTPTPGPTATPQSGTILALYSQPGEYIVGGASVLLTSVDGAFTATYDGGSPQTGEHIGIFFNGGDNSWQLDFAVPLGEVLSPGSYEGAERFPFESPRQPGLDVAGNGRGCDFVEGRFVVSDVAIGPGGVVQRFAADFEQHCEGSLAPLYGSIRINSLQTVPTPPPPRPTPDPSQVSLVLDSQAGDYIGGGRDQTLTAANGRFSGSHTFGHVGIYFDGDDLGTFWSLEFAAPECMDLTPGTYESATRYPFQSANAPGLDVSGDGRGCNASTGRFTVREADYGVDGTVNNFVADFEQHCEGGAAALLGTIRFSGALGLPPTPTPTPGVLDLSTYAVLHSEPGDYIGACEQRSLTLADGVFSATHDPGHVNIGFYGGGANDWSFDFAAPSGAELVPGSYQGAARYPFASATEPGLSIDGDGRGCNMLDGSFVVDEVEYGSEGQVLHFAAEFEQHCEGATPALSGMIRYLSTLPTPTAPAFTSSPIPSTPTPAVPMSTPTTATPLPSTATPIPSRATKTASLATRTPSPIPCTGDCHGNRSVTIDDLVTGVEIALDDLPLASCPSFDSNGDRRVTVNELLSAVNAALDGCPTVP